MTSESSAAVAAPGVDAGVAWHYGDPLGEQRRMATAAAVVDRSNRDVLLVSGEDRLGWLHSICSQHLSALTDGAATEALVLSPHGHVEQHWQVAELDGVVWLDTEPGAAPTVLDYLNRMRFLKRVEPSDVSADWAVLSVVGPKSAAVLDAAGLPVPPETGRVAGIDGGGFARRMPDLPVGGSTAVDLVVPSAQREQVWAALVSAGASAAGMWAYEALRVEAGHPRFGFDTDHRTIPHEVGWIGTAVHLDKGCYRGQETVARVQNLGRPPRRLVRVQFAGESDELPPLGTSVEVGGRSIGFLGTAVHHWELGPIGLAVVKRTVPDGSDLAIGGQIARVG